MPPETKTKASNKADISQDELQELYDTLSKQFLDFLFHLKII